MTVAYSVDGTSYNTSIPVTVGTPVPARLVAFGSLSGSLRLPQGITGYPITAFSAYQNGVREQIVFNQPDMYGNTFTYSFDPGTTGAEVGISNVRGNVAYLISTEGAQAGNATVNVYLNGSSEVFDSFTFEVLPSNVTAVNVGFVNADQTINVNQTANYNIAVTYSDGTTQDVTTAWRVENTDGTGEVSVLFKGNNVARVHEGILRGLRAGTATLSLVTAPFQIRIPFSNDTPQDNTVQVQVLERDPSFDFNPGP